MSPNGICINISEHNPGSVAEITNFRSHTFWHDAVTSRVGDKRHGEDLGEREELHPNNWAILADKGYQGLSQQMRVIHPRKRYGSSIIRKSSTKREYFFGSGYSREHF